MKLQYEVNPFLETLIYFLIIISVFTSYYNITFYERQNLAGVEYETTTQCVTESSNLQTFPPKISIYTEIIESPNLQYLSMKIPKSSGFKGQNPHHHFLQSPKIYRFYRSKSPKSTANLGQIYSLQENHPPHIIYYYYSST